MKDGLKLEKDMKVSTSLLASGLADKVGKQDDQLESCHFEKTRKILAATGEGLSSCDKAWLGGQEVESLGK